MKIIWVIGLISVICIIPSHSNADAPNDCNGKIDDWRAIGIPRVSFEMKISDIEFQKKNIQKQFDNGIAVNQSNLDKYGDCYKKSDIFRNIQKQLDYVNQALIDHDDEIKERKLEIANSDPVVKEKNRGAERSKAQFRSKNNIVEVLVEQWAIDVKKQETHFKISLKNISKGKIVRPDYEAGKEIKERTLPIKERDRFYLNDVYSGIILKDSFNNDFKLDNIMTLNQWNKSLKPQEEQIFLVNFKDIPLNNSKYIVLKIASRFTDSDSMEIKIPTEEFFKDAVEYKNGCVASCIITKKSFKGWD